MPNYKLSKPILIEDSTFDLRSPMLVEELTLDFDKLTIADIIKIEEETRVELNKRGVNIGVLETCKEFQIRVISLSCGISLDDLKNKVAVADFVAMCFLAVEYLFDTDKGTRGEMQFRF